MSYREPKPIVEVYVRRPRRISIHCHLCGAKLVVRAGLDVDGTLQHHVEQRHPQLELLTGGGS